MSNVNRGLAQDMLRKVAADIRENYYDPTLHGVNWDAAVKQASAEIDQAPSMDMAFSYIAGLVDALHDSHTYFTPPGRTRASEYGLRYQMIGDDRCYITQVRPGSDAETKGVKPGDEVITINGFLPERKSIAKMAYIFNVLRPQNSLRMRLQPVAGGTTREIQIDAQAVRRQPRAYTSTRMADNDAYRHFFRLRSVELGNELMVLKLPLFYYENSEIGSIMGRARKHKTLILDVRGNPGGAEETLQTFISELFDHDVRLADRVTRKGSKPAMIKGRHNAFPGKLIVLVDSDSASASELLARVVQLEKRGTVIGDRTSGSVMEAKSYVSVMGASAGYQEVITYANLIMSDGKSLEHVGVIPDEEVIPTAKDMAVGNDPVLARAAEIAGVKLTPEAAGKLLPYEWQPLPQ